MIWLPHISVFHVKVCVYAGGCVSVWGDIGRKLFPWRWRWLPNRAEWNSLAHSLSKFINLFWEVHDWSKNSNKWVTCWKWTKRIKGTGCYRKFCNFLATKHFIEQTSVFNCRDHFKSALADLFSLSLSLLGKFTTSPSTAMRQWRLLRSTVEKCTRSQRCSWPRIWKSMAKMLLSDCLMCFSLVLRYKPAYQVNVQKLGFLTSWWRFQSQGLQQKVSVSCSLVFKNWAYLALSLYKICQK